MVDNGLLYEDRGKLLFISDVDDELTMKFKNDVIQGNGKAHCAVASFIFEHLNNAGINTHFIYREGPAAIRVKRASGIPVKIMVRNVITGSICKRLGVQDGRVLSRPLIELRYRSESLHNPIINEEHADILGLASAKELADMRKVTLKVNRIIIALFASVDIRLIDFTLEFGKNGSGLLLKSGITESFRLWNTEKNIGFPRLSEAKLEIAKRLEISV